MKLPSKVYHMTVDESCKINDIMDEEFAAIDEQLFAKIKARIAKEVSPDIQVLRRKGRWGHKVTTDCSGPLLDKERRIVPGVSQHLYSAPMVDLRWREKP